MRVHRRHAEDVEEVGSEDLHETGLNGQTDVVGAQRARDLLGRDLARLTFGELDDDALDPRRFAAVQGQDAGPV